MVQVSVYAAGADAVVTGLVTTRTAEPEPEFVQQRRQPRLPKWQ
jgi:hypothetical protein